jgi:tetratricopeptide (TPR) repeat protein
VHDRVREVAYVGLLAIRRKLLHRQVAETLETLHADSLDSHVGALGQHYFGGEVWSKAFAYLRRAGARAYHHSAYHQAVTYYEQALGTLDHLPNDERRPADAIDVRLDLRLPLMYVAGDGRINAVLTEAERLAEAAADHERLARALAFQAVQHSAAADYRGALDLIERAIATWRSHGMVTPPEAARYLGYIFNYTGEYRSALEALEMAEQQDSGFDRGFVGDPTLRACLITTSKVTALVELGKFDEALDCADRGWRRAEEQHHHHGLALTAYARGRVALGKGDAGSAIPPLERSVALCRQGGYPSNFPVAAAWLGSAYLLAGRADDALAILSEAVQGALPTHTSCCLGLAEAYLDVGRVEEASELAEQSVATAQRIGERGTCAWGLRLLGNIAAWPERGDAVMAERHYREALALADGLGMRPLGAHCHLGLGKLYRHAGRKHEAHEHLATAKTLYAEMGMRRWRERADAALREVAAH